MFPDPARTYSFTGLPAFFLNRVMSPRRASYPTCCHWLGLSEFPTPVEFLARSGGGRATDTFHVVDGFIPVNGRVEGHFLASGVRCVEGNGSLSRLAPGDRLRLIPEPDNTVDSEAVLLTDAGEDPVGYVPDWLLGDVHGWGLPNTAVRVAQANAGAPRICGSCAGSRRIRHGAEPTPRTAIGTVAIPVMAWSWRAIMSRTAPDAARTAG